MVTVTCLPSVIMRMFTRGVVTNYSTAQTRQAHDSRGRVRTSSQTSRTAATLGSSSGSMPPPGTIHRSGWRLLLTSST